MEHYFTEITAKLIAEVMVRACIDKLDTEVLEGILQEELIKYCNEVFTCGRNIGYDDGYDDCTAGHRSIVDEAVECAYYEGYDDGLNEAVATEEATYARGFEDGRAEAESDNEAYTKEAVESAYNEGYSLGHYEGYDKGHPEGFSEGYSEGRAEVTTLVTMR